MRTYYVAVGTQDQKLVRREQMTLLELLTALQLQAEQKLSAIVMCGSRDVLDNIVCSLQDNPLFSVCGLHADLTDKEREFQVSRFQRHLAQNEGPQDTQDDRKPPETSTAIHNRPSHSSESSAPSSTLLAASRPASQAPAGGLSKIQRMPAPLPSSGPQPALVMVTTDVCVKAMPKEMQPLGVSLLIQYDLPTKKEQLTRRTAAAFGSSRDRKGNRPTCVIDFVVGAGEVERFRAVERFTSTPILEMPVHVGEMFV